MQAFPDSWDVTEKDVRVYVQVCECAVCAISVMSRVSHVSVPVCVVYECAGVRATRVKGVLLQVECG
jgi:hypothetical protein